MTESKDPLERAIELAVYAPLGIGLYLRDMAPALIGMFVARGRAEVDRRHDDVSRHVTTARSMGEVAVAFGVPMLRERAQQHLEGARVRAETLLENVGARDGAPSTTGTPPAPERATRPAARARSASDPPRAPRENAMGNGAGGDRVQTGQSNGEAVPPSGELPIPGYDALSASQVVQRLAGLGAEELAAVQAYESAHRNRRTILGKIDQLTP